MKFLYILYKKFDSKIKLFINITLLIWFDIINQ